MVDGATSSGQICKPVSPTTLEPAMIEGSRKVDGAASSGQICKPVSPTTLEPAMIEGSRRVMESGPAMESSLVFPPMRSKDPMESSHMLEKMESSFPAGFPIRVDFSKSLESSFEAWKQSGHNKQLSMESSPIIYVKGVKGLDGTRSLKMYRNKSRKRSSVWSRNMESSPTKSVQVNVQVFVPAKPLQIGIVALPWLLELWKESLLFIKMFWSQTAVFEPSRDVSLIEILWSPV